LLAGCHDQAAYGLIAQDRSAKPGKMIRVAQTVLSCGLLKRAPTVMLSGAKHLAVP